MRTWIAHWWPWICIIVVATALNLGANYHTDQQIEGTAARESKTNYENAVATCEAGNSVRRGTVIGLKTAATHATHGRAHYAAAVKEITDQPFVRADGSRNCLKAINHP